MVQGLIAQQTLMEAEALGYLARAVEAATEWVVDGDDHTRKISSVRFATEMYERQLDRLFALEEFDGYMDDACQVHYEWTQQVEELKRDHELFRVTLQRLIMQLDRASPTDLARLDAICRDVRDVIQRVRMHSNREAGLLIQSINRDSGGES